MVLWFHRVLEIKGIIFQCPSNDFFCNLVKWCPPETPSPQPILLYKWFQLNPLYTIHIVLYGLLESWFQTLRVFFRIHKLRYDARSRHINIIIIIIFKWVICVLKYSDTRLRRKANPYIGIHGHTAAIQRLLCNLDDWGKEKSKNQYNFNAPAYNWCCVVL